MDGNQQARKQGGSRVVGTNAGANREEAGDRVGGAITIYGASDDLIEIEGAISEEYYLGRHGTRLRLTAPDGQSLDIALDFGNSTIAGRLGWTISVAAVDCYPTWPIGFHERPGYEGDPAVTIDAPVGSKVHVVGGDYDD